HKRPEESGKKNRGTCAFAKVPRFHNPAIDYKIISPVQGPGLPELPLPGPQGLPELPEPLPVPQALRALQPQEPAPVLPSCCNLLPQETEKPGKAR
ncbi:MAG TPA: hypothetical protein PKU72_09475, partial [Smithellaceae bacterium]|nr:hypothetical protein [Smithellaceae bacterium]